MLGKVGGTDDDIIIDNVGREVATEAHTRPWCSY